MRIRMTPALKALPGLFVLAALALPAGASGQAAVPTQEVEVATIPPIAGVEVSSGGASFETDSEGRLTLPLATTAADGSKLSPQEALEVTRIPRLSQNARARFARVYGRPSGGLTLFFDVLHRVKPVFVNIDGEPVNPERVESITLKARTGAVRAIEGNRPVWLHAKRVVPFAGGLEVKDIEWAVQEVLVDGSNVVNRAQLSFVPSAKGFYEVPLLFYSASFEVDDALLGFPIGSAIELRYPDGAVRKHELDDSGRVTLPALARGTYDVSVDGPGYSFTRPVSVTKDQQMTLQVVSYLDLLIAASVIITVVVGLLLVRRPALRTRVRALASSLPGISSPSP
ncbi:MAG TPA: carboxypeptidase-like regulatory domain-containing protein, partial [Polyangia bacterium]|nr:carboxypeptidase-like regulatory domain-containing protein [Polyangia bacterium]